MTKFYMLSAIVFASLLNVCLAIPFTKCKGDDTKCMTAAAKALLPTFALGMPEYNVKPLDPLVIKKVDASSGNLKLIFFDFTVHGLKNCDAPKIQRDISKSKLYVHILCDVTIEGTYESSGRLLLLPIEGKGDAHLVLRQILVKVECDLTEKVGKDGKNYWSVKSWSHSYELRGKTSLKLDNLFNGNEVLSKAVKELLDHNSNDIIVEVGPPVVKAITERVVKACQRLFTALSADNLSDDHWIS